MNRESLTGHLVAQKDERLDKFLHSHIGGSRNQVERLIKKGYVKADGKIVTKAGYRVTAGAEIEYTIPREPERMAAAVDFDIPVIYEDDDILVINKPSGLVVHPAPSVKGATLVEWLKAKGVSLSTIRRAVRWWSPKTIVPTKSFRGSFRSEAWGDTTSPWWITHSKAPARWRGP